MSARPQRHKAEAEEEEANGERWMASYMDMVTVLLCLFIVLFAISSINQGKYDQLRGSLADGFGYNNGTIQASTVESKAGLKGAPDAVDEKPKKLTDEQLAIQEVDDLKQLQQRISAALTKAGLAQSVQFALDERGLTVRLVGSETYFDTGKADLTARAVQILAAIAPSLAAATGRNFSVEGHADYRNATYPYPTNWELSADRAVRVLRYLVEEGGVAADHIGAVGYGSARPLNTGRTPADLAINRRVDVVVLSNQSDSVRALIPKGIDGTLSEGGAPTP
jgi:chemotaxis protein MotB